ncbi:MAG: gliding motility-associated C-terminal domain-containing protein, partial [Bacteroidia bacterium]|nr:gliding motility-associated C-terminal domain-containing protein [Bacteroidia bacterium]
SSQISDGNDITFENIGINGKFYVAVNYPEASTSCERSVGEVDITENVIGYVHASLTNPNVCQGSGSTQVQLSGVATLDLDFYVVKVINSKTGVVLSTTAKATDFVKTGDDILFLKQYRSNINLDIQVAKKNGDGTESCPIELGHIEFKVHLLPKSFELTGRNIYCGGKSDIQLILPTSETDVEYVLYVKDGEDWVEYIYTDNDGVEHTVAVDGEDGVSVMFPKFSSTDPRFLDRGLYTVIGINKLTGCTSAMKNEVEISQQLAIDVKDIVNDVYESCSSEAKYVEISAANTQKDVIYYFYHTDDMAEVHRLESGITEDMLADIVEDQEKANDVFVRKYTGNDISFLPRVDGNYIILASYDMYACPVFLDKFTYTSYRLDKFVFSASALCGNQIVYTLSGTQENVHYEIMTNTNGVVLDFYGDGQSWTSEPVVNTLDADASLHVVASMGSCVDIMSGEVYPSQIAQNDINKDIDYVSDEYVSCSNNLTPVEILAENTQEDVVYYLYHTDDEAEIQTLEAGITEDMLSAIVDNADKAEDVTIFRHTGKNITFIPRTTGKYVLLASYAQYKCPVFLDKFTYSLFSIDKYTFTARALCDNQIVYNLSGTQDGVHYVVYNNAGDIIIEFYGNGSEWTSEPLQNDVTDEETTLYVKAYYDETECTEVMPGEVKPASLVVEEPTGSFDFLIEGTQWDRTSGVMPDVCKTSSVTLVANIKCEAVVTKYSYDFYKIREEENEEGEISIVQDEEVYRNISSVAPRTLTKFDDFDDSQAYRVVLNVFLGECCPYAIDNMDFAIKRSGSLSGRFFPDDAHIKNVADGVQCLVPEHTTDMHGDYCSDELGVGLYFLNPEQGSIYRLYQRVEEQVDENTTVEKEVLLDMQEVSGTANVEKLWFTGWGTNGSDNAYGATGTEEGTRYFVSVHQKDGCVPQTSDLVIYENPLPIDTVKTSPTYNEVFYALMDKDGLPNFEVKSNDYGIVDAGFVFLSHPKAGVTYHLIHVDSDVEPNKTVSYVTPNEKDEERGWINFGLVKSDDEAVAAGWGAGLYEVIAKSDITDCSASVGSIEFIDEELVAYNVYLYMKKNQSTVSQLLYPSENKFGNHRYIDWSRKVDLVWAPALVTDTVTGEQYMDPLAEEYPNKSGYTINEKRANIHFEMVQAMKDTVTIHDVDINEFEYADYAEKDPDNTFKQIQTRTEKYFLYQEYKDEETGDIKRDSTYTGTIFITYENGKEASRKYFDTVDENTKPTNDLGEVIETYRYWRQVYDTIQVIDYSRKYGDYGFDGDYDAIETPDLDIDSKSGLFRYTKMPSFFGKVELTYRIYNDLLPNIRFSNNAQIVILCGNSNLPGTDAVFLVPNAFSPNGDGLNDEFRIILPHGYENSQVVLEVFNRWGTRVYKSSGIRYGIDCPYWDGTSTTSNMVTVGEKLPSGTYYYVLTINVNNPSTGETEDLDLKGFIELRR